MSLQELLVSSRYHVAGCQWQVFQHIANRGRSVVYQNNEVRSVGWPVFLWKVGCFSVKLAQSTTQLYWMLYYAKHREG